MGENQPLCNHYATARNADSILNMTACAVSHGQRALGLSLMAASTGGVPGQNGVSCFRLSRVAIITAHMKADAALHLVDIEVCLVGEVRRQHSLGAAGRKDLHLGGSFVRKIYLGMAHAAKGPGWFVKFVAVALVARCVLIAARSWRLSGVHILGRMAVRALEPSAFVADDGLGPALCVSVQLVREAVAIRRNRLLARRRKARFRAAAARGRKQRERHGSQEAQSIESALPQSPSPTQRVAMNHRLSGG